MQPFSIQFLNVTARYKNNDTNRGNEMSWHTPAESRHSEHFIRFVYDGEWYWRPVSLRRHMDNIKRRVRNFRRQRSVALRLHCLIPVSLFRLSRLFRIVLSSRSPVYLAVLFSFRAPLYSSSTSIAVFPKHSCFFPKLSQ